MTFIHCSLAKLGVPVSITTKAPANLMLMGEHSVVYGHPAIACAINQWLTIHWEIRHDDRIEIKSNLAHHLTDVQTLEDHAQLKWVMASLKHYQPWLKTGLTLTIESDFSANWGLGSSAAVLTAMLGGLNQLTQQNSSHIELFNIGLSIIHQIQGKGSGTDLAASLSGGMILFDPKVPRIEKLDILLPISLLYSGYKTPTAEVLEIVAKNWQKVPGLLTELYQLMGHSTTQAFHALQKKDWDTFYQMVNHYQGLMDALGVNDSALSALIYQLRADPNTLASKISGSGLGDCVLAFGAPDLGRFKDHLSPKMSTLGLQVITRRNK